MNKAIQSLKERADAAVAAYQAENARLAALGMKSRDRYEACRPLKAAQDAAWAAYVKGSHAGVKRELDKIIVADRPARKAAEFSRSAWKRAKAGL